MWNNYLFLCIYFQINTIGKGEVAASWGGYSASAGLGGGPNGGGLHAEAAAPSAGASAGLGGGTYSSSQAGAHAEAGTSAGAGVGGTGVHHGGSGVSTSTGGHKPGFFDNVFNVIWLFVYYCLIKLHLIEKFTLKKLF